MTSQHNVTLGIGIDTGGTYTDSAIVDLATGNVLSKAKALTTREDLVKGIRNSLALLDRGLFPRVRLAGLSTTLATNSIVEGKGSRVGLIYAVPDPSTFAVPASIPAEHVAVIAGAHDGDGAVTVTLDSAAAAEIISRFAGDVDAFAVTGFYSIYNAEHEQRLKEMIAAVCDKPVVCGSELSSDVGMLERGTTAALNAKLLPVIGELLHAVRNALDENGINAPLMVVKGDGSLLREKLAASVPVETVLSGPAASIVGACRLTGLDDAVVVDMGGTTTDIAIMRGASVRTSKDGAEVGGWKTRVHAVDMWTIGLGGDSRITVQGKDDILIGPRKAIPLSLAAVNHPELMTLIEDIAVTAKKKKQVGDLEFFTLVRRPNFPLSRNEEQMIAALEGGILDRGGIVKVAGRFVAVERFVELGLVAEVTFTPTDLLHARGDLTLWDGRTARLAAGVLAEKVGMTIEQFLETVFDKLVLDLKVTIAARVLADDGVAPAMHSPQTLAFLRGLLGQDGATLSFRSKLEIPLIAVGAPVHSYFPRVAEGLGARLVIPEHAEVANAVGAVTGRVVERAEALIKPVKDEEFVVVSPTAHGRFATIEEAVAFAEEGIRSLALKRARESGGTDIEVVIERDDDTVPVAGTWGDGVLLEVRLTATAVGRPFPV